MTCHHPLIIIPSSLTDLGGEQERPLRGLAGGEDRGGAPPDREAVGAVRGEGEGGDDEEDADPGPGLHPPVAGRVGGERTRVVGGLEDGQTGPAVVETLRLFTVGGGGGRPGVRGGVGGAGPAGRLAPHWLEGAQVAGQAGPGRAGVVVARLAGV